MSLIVREMQKPESGLEVKDRLKLDLQIYQSFILIFKN